MHERTINVIVELMSSRCCARGLAVALVASQEKRLVMTRQTPMTCCHPPMMAATADENGPETQTASLTQIFVRPVEPRTPVPAEDETVNGIGGMICQSVVSRDVLWNTDGAQAGTVPLKKGRTTAVGGIPHFPVDSCCVIESHQNDESLVTSVRRA